ncbi:MAG: hypothetical protein ACP5TO_08160, partial [Thermoplasmata archaeon]
MRAEDHTEDKEMGMPFAIAILMLAIYMATLEIPDLRFIGYLYFRIPNTSIGISYIGFVSALIISLAFIIVYTREKERIPERYLALTIS